VQTLLQSKVSITRLRGNWHTYLGIKLMPTFHPAYLLRNPADKKLVWEDIQKVMKEMQGENA
jgi:DNA polymerase